MKKLVCETTIAGETIFRRIFAGREYLEKGRPRCERKNITSDMMREQNDKNSERKLMIKINHNFKDGDLHLVWTYRGDEPTHSEAKKEMERALRRLRKVFREKNVILKYIAVTEYSHTRIHHHIICTGDRDGVNYSEIRDCWTAGKTRPTWMDTHGDYQKLAAYLIKETKKTFRNPETAQKRRYTCSRTIETPETIRELVGPDELNNPRAPKGWFVDPDSIFEGINPYTENRYKEYVIKKEHSAAKYRKKNGWVYTKPRYMRLSGWIAEHEDIQTEFGILGEGYDN